MVLRRCLWASVVDSLNYGLLVDPWAAEGYQATAGSGQSGCRVNTPGPGRSAGRFPDGHDTDSNCSDFRTQAVTLAAASAVGTTNITVASVEGFEADQKIMVDTGANQETAVIATVGTGGATTVDAAHRRWRDPDSGRQFDGLHARRDDHHRQRRERRDGGGCFRRQERRAHHHRFRAAQVCACGRMQGSPAQASPLPCH